MTIKRITPSIILATIYKCGPGLMDGCPDLVDNPDYWREVKYLWHPVAYQVGDETIEIQAGFPTDGASIPAACAALAYDRYDHKVLGGALLHDWLYATNYLPRDVADDCLFHLWVADGVPTLKALAMKEAVRIGGAGAYNDSKPGASWYMRFGKITKELTETPDATALG